MCDQKSEFGHNYLATLEFILIIFVMASMMILALEYNILQTFLVNHQIFKSTTDNSKK